MAYTFAFTVTQVVNSFTATITTPLSLALTNTPDSVAITNNTATVVINNNIQPVTVSGGQTQFNQSLNTTDNVSFASVSTPRVYGYAGGPVAFPNGISVASYGVEFAGPLDFSGYLITATNVFALLLAASPIDFGSLSTASTFSVNFGTI